VINSARVRDLWRRLCPSAAPATYRVRGTPKDEGGWNYTDYALTHVARETLERYQPAGGAEATADRAKLQVWADDLAAVSAPAPKRHDLIVQGGVTYEIDRVGDYLFDAVYIVFGTKAGPGDAP